MNLLFNRFSAVSLIVLTAISAGCYPGRYNNQVGFGDRAQQFEPTAASEQSNNHKRGTRLTERFKNFDRNGDGILTREEVARPRLFERLDQNTDGSVTFDEARSHSMHRRQNSTGESLSSAEAGSRPFPQQSTYRQAHPENFRPAARRLAPSIETSAYASPISYNSDEDSAAEDDGYSAAEDDESSGDQRQFRTQTPLSNRGNTNRNAKLINRFKQFDANNDGALSAQEINRPDLFQRLDQNHDGLATLEEARLYRDHRRQLAYNAGDTRSDAAGGFAPTRASERRGFARNNSKAFFENDSTINQTRNIPYTTLQGVNPSLLSLDVYAPKNSQDRPVIIMIHGGGWQRGDKANANVIGNKVSHFVRNGYVFVSTNYRLSPAVKHPAHVQDVAKAVAWVQQNITRYGGNPDRIYLMGHSSGAHLAALVATDQRYLQAAGVNLRALKGVILLDSAGYNIPRLMRDHNQPRIYVNAFSNDQRVWKDASPITHVSAGKGIPPFLIIQTPRARAKISDDLRNALQQAGISVRSKMFNKSHRQINQEIGQPNDEPTQLIMDFLNSK